jgi:diguanylate cyclase (GGDEF)-like protein
LLRLTLTSTLAEALETTEQVDVIVLDVGAVGEHSLPEAIGLLTRHVPGAGIAISSPSDDLDTRVAAARAGAQRFMVKPIGRQTLLGTVRQLRRRASAPRPRVLVIDDDADFVALTEAVLTDAGYATVGLTDSEPILENLRRLRPDAILVDLGMPRYDGIELTAMLRNSREFDNTPVLFVSGHGDPGSIRAAFAAGADDFLTKPVSAADLTMRLQARLERARLLRGSAEKDELTGLLTRGPFEAALENRIASSIRHGKPTSLCLIDLDHFKRVNDTYGHAVGDDVLAAFGHLLRTQFRAEDLKCRWGGEEFAVAFPAEQDGSVVRVLIERLLVRFESLAFNADSANGADGGTFSASFSAGIAHVGVELADLDELIKVADDRLYLAKAAGRGRVVDSDTP